MISTVVCLVAGVNRRMMMCLYLWHGCFLMIIFPSSFLRARYELES